MDSNDSLAVRIAQAASQRRAWEDPSLVKQRAYREFLAEHTERFRREKEERVALREQSKIDGVEKGFDVEARIRAEVAESRAKEDAKKVASLKRHGLDKEIAKVMVEKSGSPFAVWKKNKKNP